MSAQINITTMDSGIIDHYNVNEEYLYSKPYLFIKGFATHGNFKYTLKALPLARKIHNGQYRKGTVIVDDKEVQLPYILHCLKVCSTLISLNLPMTDKELDILYASAILHDVVEDGSQYFPNGGKELTSIYGFPKEVTEVVLLLSKRSGASVEELTNYFNKIKKNKIASLIKLADRSHNVEDLYNMKLEKLHKYIIETRFFIYPLATYTKQNSPELSNGITILKAKIVSLTELTETLVDLYEDRIKEIEEKYNDKISKLESRIQDLEKKSH